MSLLFRYLLIAVFTCLILRCKTDKANNQNHKNNNTSLTKVAIDSSHSEQLSNDTIELTRENVSIDSNTTIQKAHEPKSTKAKERSKRAKIKFEKEVIDFGEIEEGAIIDHQFHFTNVGSAELEILSAKGSCGCSQPSFPFIAIEPGGLGFIGVNYNSVGKLGEQSVNIKVRTNESKKEYILYLKGLVKEKLPNHTTEKDSIAG